MLNIRTLVLDASYTPINIFPSLHSIPCEDALTRVFNGTCHIVAEYDRKIKTANPEYQVKIPSVIARNEILHREPVIALQLESLYYRDHAVCAYCAKEVDLKNATKDHVFPRSRGGEDTWENIVLACPTCNHTKSNALPEGRWAPKHKPYAPNYWDLLASRRKFPILVHHESWKDFIGPWYAPIIVREDLPKSA